MGKLIDITDRLSFESNPRLQINDTVLEVNADAATMIKVLALMSDGEKTSAGNVLEAVGLLFSAGEQEKLDGLKLSFGDYLTVITAAMEVVSGNGGRQGEAVTRTTT